MRRYVKQIVLVLLMIALVYCFSGCEAVQGVPEKGFSARYFRDGFDLGDDGVAVICSRKELEDIAREYGKDAAEFGYYEYFLNDNAYELAQKGITKGQRPTKKDSMLEVFEEYTESFFEEHYLVLISRNFDSYDDAFRVERIEATEDSKLSISLSFILPYEKINYETGEISWMTHPSTGGWSFLLELKREIGIASEDKVVINIDRELDIYKDVYFDRYD